MRTPYQNHLSKFSLRGRCALRFAVQRCVARQAERVGGDPPRKPRPRARWPRARRCHVLVRRGHASASSIASGVAADTAHHEERTAALRGRRRVISPTPTAAGCGGGSCGNRGGRRWRRQRWAKARGFGGGGGGRARGDSKPSWLCGGVRQQECPWTRQSASPRRLSWKCKNSSAHVLTTVC